METKNVVLKLHVRSNTNHQKFKSCIIVSLKWSNSEIFMNSIEPRKFDPEKLKEFVFHQTWDFLYQNWLSLCQ